MYPPPDIVLHIGLAAGRLYYTFEKGAHGRGYGVIPDVDGEKFTDEMAEEVFPADSFPGVLHTSFDTDDVMARWRSNLGYSSTEDPAHDDILPDVRPSPDAGNFLCGFTYYNSLARYHVSSKNERPVAFLHVPDLSTSEEKLAVGRNVAINLIKALVESKRNVGVTNQKAEAALQDEDKVGSAGTDVNFAS